MATTTNYGWTTPDDTSLVKDGASAIRTLGSSVDTTVKNLNPETTLGDISYRSSTANTNTRLAIGTSGQVLTVSGGVPAWTTVSSGGMTLLSTTTLSGAATDITNIDQTYNTLEVWIYGVTNATASSVFWGRPRNGTTALDVFNVAVDGGSSPSGLTFGARVTTRLSGDATEITMDRTNANNFWVMRIANYASTTNYKSYEVAGGFYNTSGQQVGRFLLGHIASNSAVNSLRFDNSGGSFNSGTVKIYGVK